VALWFDWRDNFCLFHNYSLVIFLCTIFLTTDSYYWIAQMIRDFDMSFLLTPTLLFLVLYILAHIFVGILFGTVSSYSAVHKYLEKNGKK
jgi:predicted membrane protein